MIVPDLPPYHYRVLDIAVDADDASIRAAWLRARAAAPVSGLPLLQAWIQGRSRRGIDRAYQVLSDPASRAAYDRESALDAAIAQYRCWS